MELLWELTQSKKRWEAKLEKMKKRKNKAGKTAFDFPNFTVPLLLVNFAPAFACGFFTATLPTLKLFAALWVVFAVGAAYLLCKPGRMYFAPCGDATRIREYKNVLEMGVKKRVEAGYYLMFCILFAVVAHYITTTLLFYLFLSVIGFGGVSLALHPYGPLWTTTPMRILRFDRYKFIPDRTTEHFKKDSPVTVVLRNRKTLRITDPLEMTFAGNHIFYLQRTIQKDE